ncbi:Gfo/Idh/MocA family oxidoreductase [candidate division KSB1 bacterium]|nr:Gfo/Idh/MocA family oxidoreductase [candidate division KSB1 bacterium]
MPVFKVGLIGVGKLGEYHCNALSQLKDAELTGIYDIESDRKKQVADKYNCRAFESVEELIKTSEIIGIIVPTTRHLETAKQALAAGKPVFVEKPIASSIAEAEEMVSLAAERNVPLQTGHIERFNPAIRALNNFDLHPMFIESHRLAPFDPRGTDVAVILDLMIHDIDIILSLVKSKVAEIHANGVAIVSGEIDIANARIQFENGCVANVTASRISQRKMRKMRLFQKDSYISIDFLQRLTELFQIVDESNFVPNTMSLGQIEKGKHKRNIIYTQPQPPDEDAMQAEWKSFFHAIETGGTPVVSGQDGLEALKIATEITEIIKNQKI